MQPESPTELGSQRPNLRLTLRALIILVLIIGAGLGWVAYRARVQRDAVAAVERGGGSVRYDWELDRVRDASGDQLIVNPERASKTPRFLVNLLGPDYFATVKSVHVGPRDGDLVAARVSRLGQVEYLSLGAGATLTDEGVRLISHMVGLRTLLFRSGARFPNGTGVTPNGIRSLERLTRLQSLDLPEVPLGKDDLAFLRKMTDLRNLTLQTAAGADLSVLRDLKKLQRLRLAGLGLTDANFVHLQGLTQLTRLQLGAGRLTSAGLAHVRPLHQLEELQLDRNQVDDLTPIRDLTGLTSVILRGNSIDDRAIAPLAKLRRLETVFLFETKITGTGLAQLQDLPRLKWIRLNGSPATDEGLRDLPNLKSLRTLDLNRTQVTDACLDSVAGLKSLVRLRITETRITKAGIAAFQKANPAVTIQR